MKRKISVFFVLVTTFFSLLLPEGAYADTADCGEEVHREWQKIFTMLQTIRDRGQIDEDLFERWGETFLKLYLQDWEECLRRRQVDH